MTDEQELLIQIQNEFDNSGGGLSLSTKEFAEYFELEDKFAEEIIQKLLTTERYQISEHIDSSSGKGIDRLHIHTKYMRNYQLKSVLTPSEAQAILELGALLKEPLDSRIKNLTIEGQHLVKLIIQDQDIISLPPEIGNFTHLNSLKLHRCKLTSLPETIGNLTKLKELDLDSNNLISLPETIGKLENLQELWCRHNKLIAFPEILDSLKNLQILSLDHNKLTSLPDSLHSLKKLQRLSLESNILTDLPELLGNLSSLEILRLRGNELTKLPETCRKLDNLQRLDLQENLLKTFPVILINMHNLQYINLNSNQVRELPESIGGMESLQYLKLKNNQLLSLPKTVQNLKNLIVILVSGNKLNNESRELLQELYQSGIKISEEFRTTIPNVDVRNIRVNDTKIKLILMSIEEDSFGNIKTHPCRGAVAAIILFEKNNRSSFDSVKDWFDELRTRIPDKSNPLALVGVITENNIISKSEGERLADELGMNYYETTLYDEKLKTRIFQELVKKRFNGVVNGDYLLKICIIGSGRKFKDGTPSELVYRFTRGKQQVLTQIDV